MPNLSMPMAGKRAASSPSSPDASKKSKPEEATVSFAVVPKPTPKPPPFTTIAAMIGPLPSPGTFFLSHVLTRTPCKLTHPTSKMFAPKTLPPHLSPLSPDLVSSLAMMHGDKFATAETFTNMFWYSATSMQTLCSHPTAQVNVETRGAAKASPKKGKRGAKKATSATDATSATFGASRSDKTDVSLLVNDLLGYLVDPSTNPHGPIYLSPQSSTSGATDAPLYATPPLSTLSSTPGSLPTSLPIAGNLKASYSNAWLFTSPTKVESSSSGMHYDYHDNFYLVLRGYKRVRVIKKEFWKECGFQTPGFEEDDAAAATDASDDEEDVVIGKGADYDSDDEESAAGGVFENTAKTDEDDHAACNDEEEEEDSAKANFSAIDVSQSAAVIAKNYPEFSNVHADFVDVGPGEMLYLPGGTIHEVTSYCEPPDDWAGKKHAAHGKPEKLAVVDAKAVELPDEGGWSLAINWWYEPPRSDGSFKDPYTKAVKPVGTTYNVRKLVPGEKGGEKEKISLNSPDSFAMKLMTSRDVAGGIIGPQGKTHKALEATTATRVSVSTGPFPGSDYSAICVQGKQGDVVDALKIIVEKQMKAQLDVKSRSPFVTFIVPSGDISAIIGIGGGFIKLVTGSCDVKIKVNTDNKIVNDERLVTIFSMTKEGEDGAEKIMRAIGKIVEAMGEQGTFKHVHVKYNEIMRDQGREQQHKQQQVMQTAQQQLPPRRYASEGLYAVDLSQSNRGPVIDPRQRYYHDPNTGGYAQGNVQYAPNAPYHGYNAPRPAVPPPPQQYQQQGAYPPPQQGAYPPAAPTFTPPLGSTYQPPPPPRAAPPQYTAPYAAPQYAQQGAYPPPQYAQPQYAAAQYAQPPSAPCGGGEEAVSLPDNYIPALLGRGGENLNAIMAASGTKISVSQKGDYVPGTTDRTVTIIGPEAARASAKAMMKETISRNPPDGRGAVRG